MDRNELLRQLGISSGALSEAAQSGEMPPALTEWLAENEQYLQQFDHNLGVRNNPARSKRFAHLMEEKSLKDDIASRYGRERANDSRHLSMVRNITEAVMENACAFGMNGKLKSRQALIQEGIAQQQMPSWFNPASLLTEDTLGPLATSGGITTGAWTTLALGLVRRIYPKLLAFELFSVQPMRLPTWRIFFQKFLRDAAAGSTALHTQADFDETYADRANETDPVRLIEFDLEHVDVQAKTKALRYSVSEEAIQDIRAYWGLDLESEMMNGAEDEILREIDYELLKFAHLGATAGDVFFDPTPPAGSDVVNTKEHQRTLYERLIDAKVAIGNKVQRSPSWIIGSLEDVARLEKLEEFKMANDVDFNLAMTQRHFRGTLQDQVRVYRDPWWQFPGEMLVGYKGDRLTDTGLVYAPYIPLFVAPRIPEPNLTVNRSMMSRYAKHIVNGDAYARIIIQSS